MSSDMPRILLIAGSDSSGGAGLEADQKVAAVHGCYAMTATTALTAQNTQAVHDIHEIPADFVRKQINACIEDIGVDVVKTGMLASAKTVSVVADALKRHRVEVVVVDPVMVATTGSQLLPEDAVQILLRDLLPVTTILTPNVPEAELLVEKANSAKRPTVENLEDLIDLATELQKLGPSCVLLKGGHLPLSKDGKQLDGSLPEERYIHNILSRKDGVPVVLRSRFQDSKNTHGTGCSLATAIASNLARGLSVERAVESAIQYVDAGIDMSLGLGLGNGPINHFHSLQVLPFVRGNFISYLLDRIDVRQPWRDYTEHDFVNQMGKGTLPVENFKTYLIQDYLFLIQFSRANALAAYKSKSIDDINRSAEIVRHVHNEMGLHIAYCADFGLSKDQILMHEEKQACTAYTRYVLDVGQSEDWFALQIALLPCLLGYGQIARRLHDDPNTVRNGNIYLKWIENYVAPDYTEAVELGSDLVERHAINQSPTRIEELVRIFIHATKMEMGFWEMGLKL